ncbi:MAG: TldD/PmbA family protein [Candidatus Wallacebacter cryptica]|nr:TldD/PmbA family protein [Bacillota bacterium]
MHLLDLKQYSSLFSGYTELRAQENRSLSIGFLKGSNTRNVKSASSGISARVYQHGSWGFASSPDLNDDNIRQVLKAASDNAAFLDSKQNKQKPPLPTAPVTAEHDFSTNKQRLSQKQLIDFVKQIDDYIAAKYPDLVSRYVGLNCLDMEKQLITADGSYSYSLNPRTLISVSLTSEKDGRPIELYDVFGSRGQFEDVFEDPADLFPQIDALYEHLRHKLEGVYAEPGLKECILDAELGGILAHEAIGHTTEADLVLGGSVAAKAMNQQVASPLVTLVDFAHHALGEICPMPIFVDDEGTNARDAVIIEEGILKSYLHSKESAQHFNVAPTGNARAWSFSDEPLIRMRNTAIMPGKDSLDDMISSIEDGYYLIRPSNGQADTTSEFMFGVVLGYEIKNGKLGRAIFDTTISGVAFEMLKTVTMVSDEMKWLVSGMCGKKQPMPVGMGGPAIKCRVNIGGR